MRIGIRRFDAEKFNHDLTGYKLTGAHIKAECNACHKDDRIESAELKKKENTYLGLKTTCISCHKDAHNNTLSTNDCAKCHDTEAFAPAPLFDHSKSKFPLKGKHKDVDCKRCHEITFVNSALFQKFAGVPFNSCVVCHEDEQADQTDSETALRHEFAGSRILLVEDEPINREIAQMLFEDIGFVVDSAEDGVQAVELASQQRYELILMDMQMPRMDGLEATRRIRALPAGNDLLIIAMTANAFAEDRERCLAAGMDYFATKPIDPDVFMNIILTGLRAQRANSKPDLRNC